MMEMVIKIMVELLTVLALATKQINQGGFSKSSCPCIVLSSPELMGSLAAEEYTRKILGGKDIGSILQWLDRLTLESKMSVVQTLSAVYGLVNNMRVVMEGAYHPMWICEFY